MTDAMTRREMQQERASRITLKEAVDEYVDFLLMSLSEQTVKNKRTHLSRLVRTAGPDTPPREITVIDMDNTYTLLRKTNAAGGMNNARATFGKFFAWCRARQYVPVSHDPSFREDRWHDKPRKRLWIDFEEFDTVLNKPEHPRDRMIVALGLYLLLRESEVQRIKLGQIDLDEGWIHDVEISKKQGKETTYDKMPINEDLDRELRKWLKAYTEEVGPLKAEYYLIPSREAVRDRDPEKSCYSKEDPVTLVLRPSLHCGTPARVVGDILRSLGYPATNTETGRKYAYGIHILRRSGARAWFDGLREMGYDGALQFVRAMLHHETVATTELYLGLDNEKNQRDKLVRARPAFGGRTRSNGNKVVDMRFRRKT